MLTMIRAGVTTVILLVAFAGCTSSGRGSATPDAGEGGSADAPGQTIPSDAAASGAAACEEAGGSCIPGPPSNCTSGNFGPPNCDPGPGGSVCCLPASADAAGEDAALVSCASAQDCAGGPIPAGPGVWCCLEQACVYGQSAIEAAPCTDAAAQAIQASNYDQSCNIDSDCIAVSANFCFIICPNAAINKSAYAQYRADFARTVCGGVTSCGSIGGPCCRSGSCQMGDQCLAPADAAVHSGDASAE
jgi:hypothetical protein